MNKVFYSISFLLATGFIYSQEISGKVIDASGKGIGNVTIEVPNTEIYTYSNDDGSFFLEDVNGANQLDFSMLGYKTKHVDLSQDNLNEIVLYEGVELLDIKIQGRNSNAFSRKETAYVGKMPLKDLENSTIYSTVTTELLESQVVTNLDDALSNATGVFKLWSSTDRNAQGTGFFSTRGFATQPKLVDGLPGYVFSSVDPSYIERIEVIKGPNATLFGSTETSLGGLINVVTKKPYKGFGGQVSYTSGSFDLHRIATDVNTPISEKNNIYFRLNTSYLTQGSFQDAGSKKALFFAPSMTYQVNNRLDLSLGLEYLQKESINPSTIFLRRGLKIPTNSVKEMGLDPNKSFTSDAFKLKGPALNMRGIAEYKISDEWNSQTLASYSYASGKGYYSYMYEGAINLFAVLQPLTGFGYDPLTEEVDKVLGEAFAIGKDDSFLRVISRRDNNASKFNIQQNFNGNFKIGDLRNRMVIGLDYVQRSNENNDKFGNPVLSQQTNFPKIINILNTISPGQGDALSAQLSSFSYFDGIFDTKGNVIQNSFTPNAQYSIDKESLDRIYGQIDAVNIKTKSKTYAAYISNVLNVTDRLILNVGLRLDYFDQDGDINNKLDDYTKTTLSPTGGIVYELIEDDLTIFSNYQSGFINNDPDIDRVLVKQSDGTEVYELKAVTADPTEAKQFEVGFKGSLFNHKLTGGVSYYNIVVNDMVGFDATAPIFPRSVSYKEMVSRGVEFEINASPLRNLNVRASYAYNDAYISDSYVVKDDKSYPEIEGYRLEQAGPRNLYNFWLDYKMESVTSEFLNKIGFGVGFNGATEQYSINNAVAGTFKLPSYTILNAAAYYDTNKLRVGVKVNNITDKHYYTGWSTVEPQAPLAFLGTVSYKF